MNDEIKEIFDTKLYFDLEEEDYAKIKNYITNLQQENDDLKNRLENAVADCNLRLQENEELNKMCEMYSKSLYCAELTDYKSRVEKVVELIKNKLSFETHQHLKKLYDDIDSIEEIWEDYEFGDLLNILLNGSENNE